MSEITDFRKGVRAIYDYLLCRAANHFHGHEDVQKQCDYDNELVTSWAEDALASVSPEDYNDWLSITEQADRITSLESHNRELLAVIAAKDKELTNIKNDATDPYAITCAEEALEIKPGDIALIEVGFASKPSIQNLINGNDVIVGKKNDIRTESVYALQKKEGK